MSLSNVPKRNQSLLNRNEVSITTPKPQVRLTRSSSLSARTSPLLTIPNLPLTKTVPVLARSSSLETANVTPLEKPSSPLTKTVPVLTRSSSLSAAKVIPLEKPSLLLASKPSTSIETKPRRRSLSLPQKPETEIMVEAPPIPKVMPPSRSSSLKRNRAVVDEDVRKSLIDWKYKSKVDWSNLFTSTSQLWSTNDNIFGSIENLLLPRKRSVVNDNDYKEIQIIVDSLWLENDQFATKKNIASYLGKIDVFHHKILSHYLDRFDFSNLTIEEAFRKLCSKLYFKAEAQEIDRILEAFSYKYWNSNINYHSLYKSPDIIYTITYSIMLLNTDLYFISSNHTKMTCQLFCENTMSTILEHTPIKNEECIQSIEDNLKAIYTSVKNQGILQPIDSSLERKPSLLKRMGSLSRKKKQ